MKEGFQGSRAVVYPASVIKDMEGDPFQSRLHITDIGYYPAASNHRRQRKDGITQYVLIYCVNGRGWFELDGQRHEVTENMFFILPAGKPHSYGASKADPWTIYWIHFKGELAGFYARGLDVPTSINPGGESRIRERLGVFEDIFSTLDKGYSRDNIDYAISALYYFLGTIKYIGQYRESAGGRRAGKTVVDEVIRYMLENLEKQITLKQICSWAGYSESYFTRLFKSVTGYAPVIYMNRLRIQTACKMLDLTDYKINQICHKVGMQDPYYFSRVFTKTMGCSPSEYKSRMKG